MWPFWLLVSVVGLWFSVVIAFVTVMHAKAIIERGEDIHWFFGAPVLALGGLGLVLDVVFNWTIGCVIYHERPHEWTFTARCKRHKRKSFGWRQERALWWCAEMSKYDKTHC
jgi:hypothetical protein